MHVMRKTFVSCRPIVIESGNLGALGGNLQVCHHVLAGELFRPVVMDYRRWFGSEVERSLVERGNIRIDYRDRSICRSNNIFRGRIAQKSVETECCAFKQAG